MCLCGHPRTFLTHPDDSPYKWRYKSRCVFSQVVQGIRFYCYLSLKLEDIHVCKIPWYSGFISEYVSWRRKSCERSVQGKVDPVERSYNKGKQFFFVTGVNMTTFFSYSIRIFTDSVSFNFVQTLTNLLFPFRMWFFKF